MNKLQAPPYAKELLELRRRGGRPNLFLHAGDHAWRRAQGRPPGERMCLPPNVDYLAVDWTCIKGLELVLVVWGRDPEYVAEFARHLVRSGAALVAAIGRGDSGTVGKCYRPAPASVAA
jgi:hypothetical protein